MTSKLDFPAQSAVKEFEIPYSSESEEDRGDKTSYDIIDSDNYVTSRKRTSSKVSFTIGDSSDCDSFSTASSTTRDTPADIQDGGEIQWNKFHFHYEPDSNNIIGNGEATTNACLDKDMEDIMKQNATALSQSTTEMIPNSSDFNISVQRLIDVDEDDKGREGGISCWNHVGKWRILVACAIVQFFSALMVSLQAPFYPAEAEKKGATATAYGFVFGVFELTVFLVAPFYGSKIHKWNPKIVFHIGILTAAISSIIFGFMDKIDNGNYFIAACAIVRAVEAVGESAVVTASFIVVASAFPDSVASTFAILEAFYSIGLMSGPIVGSVLYQLGGYSLPFFVVGGSLLLTALLSLLILPSFEEISTFQASEPLVISSYKSFRLLKSWSVVVSGMCIVTSAMSIAYLQATLEPHLRQLQISQLTTGAILIINIGIYTVTAPFWGLLCDKVVQLKLITFTGAAVLLGGFSVIGPVPVFDFQPKLWIIALGLALQGIGLGAVLVSSFLSILRNVINSGYSDSPSTYGLVSSLWTSMFSFGSFVGPSLAGILYDSVGFPWGTLSVISVLMIMMCFLLLFICISKSETESFLESENEPLLNGTTLSASIYSGNNPAPSTSKVTRFTKPIKHGSLYGSI